MQIADEYRLQEYQDLGVFEEKKHIRLKRHRISGRICLEKRVPLSQAPIYQYIQKHKISGIPEIFECVADDEELIVIEKYIEGQTLEALIRERTFNEEEIIDVMLSLCESLHQLHHAESPIICRDLKAENIMLDGEKRPWLVDFDIARVFQAGKKRDTELLGTAEYAAPEQFGFFQTDSRTDIYSLGVLMNYMATGKFPVEQMTGGKLGPIIETCTYLDPAKRYQDIEQLQQALRRIGGREQDEPQASRLRFWLPPGFRTGELSHMITALAGYGLITYLCFTMEMTSAENVVYTGMRLRIEQAIFWLAAVLVVFVYWNYRGWRDQLPLVGSKNKVFRLLGTVLIAVIGLFGAIFVCALVETLFFS